MTGEAKQNHCVSVVVATYNGAIYLREQLESIAAQTRLPDEMIICDDGSADNSIAVAEAWAKTAPFPVKAQRNERNLGYSDNFLHGATDGATGDIILFSDQDDVWLPTKIEKGVAPLLHSHEVVLSAHTTEAVGADLAPLGYRFPPIPRSETIKRGRMEPWRSLTGMTYAFKRILLDAVPWRDRPLSNMAPVPIPHDQWLLFVASAIGDVALIAEPLALYRQHGANQIGSAEEKGARRVVATARQTGAVFYQELASLALDWARALRRGAATATNPDLASRLERGAARYDKVSENARLRAALYDAPGGASRGLAYARMVARGGYRSRAHGGWGIKSLLKDTGVLLGRI